MQHLEEINASCLLPCALEQKFTGLLISILKEDKTCFRTGTDQIIFLSFELGAICNPMRGY